jgi:hypothetical protein
MKLLIALLVFSNLASAQIEYEGRIRGTSKPCSLRIDQIYYENNNQQPENLRADIVASLEDEHHHLSHVEEFFFTIKLGSRPYLFSGLGANQKDQINVLTKAGTTDLNNVDSYAIKWLHGNHFHSAQCVNLNRVQD